MIIDQYDEIDLNTINIIDDVENVVLQSIKDSFLSFDDLTIVLFLVVAMPVIFYLVGRILYFIADFIKNMLKKIYNPSIIYTDDNEEYLDKKVSLDSSNFLEEIWKLENVGKFKKHVGKDKKQ